MKLARDFKFPTLQADQSDCGVACLSAIIIFYGGYIRLEKLRELSGTTRQGTTLLGLSQAASKIGLSSTGHEMTLENLKNIDSPCILHVNIDDKYLHYVVCYGFENGFFLIGDPAKGMLLFSENELSSIWRSHVLLVLIKTDLFQKNIATNNEKKKWLKQFVYVDMSILFLIMLLGLVVSFSGIIISIFSQQLVDHILPSANIRKLIIGLVMVCFILLVRSLVNYLRNNLLNIHCKEFNNRLINYFYSSLLYLPKGFFNSRKIGELVARMEDTTRIQTILAFIFGDLIKDVLLTCVSIGIIYYYSLEVGLLTTLFIPIFFLIEKHYHKKIIYCQYEVMNANAKKTSSYINTLSGIDAVKIHNKENAFAITNKLVYGVFQDKVFRLGKVGISLQLVTDAVSVLLIMAVISESAFLVLSKNLQFGGFLAVTSLAGIMIPSIGNIAFANTRIQGARVAFERMYDFTGLEPEYPVETRSILNSKTLSEITFSSLEFKDVMFHFPGRRPIFNKATFEFKFGEITAVLGESGSGKTSLLNLLQRFYEPSAGLILLNKAPIQSTPIFLWRDCIGVVSQDPNIFNGFLLENICLSPASEDQHLAYEFCCEYGFDKYFSKFPHGYSTLLGDEGLNLSGGQRQLVALARALYKKPKVLLLDEPTSAMDSDLENFVINLLLSLKDQMATLIITHRMTMSEFADKTLVLSDGHIQKKAG